MSVGTIETCRPVLRMSVCDSDSVCFLKDFCRADDDARGRLTVDPSATLGSTQESARSHLIGGMARTDGNVLSLRAYVQLPQHISDELLHVLMATVVKGDARALSVGEWCGGHDPIRVDDDGLIVRLRELHECHERSILPVGRASGARRPETCDARASRSSLCTKNVKARRFKWLAAV